VVALANKLVAQKNVKDSITLTPNVSPAQELPPPHLPLRLLSLMTPRLLPLVNVIPIPPMDSL